MLIAKTSFGGKHTPRDAWETLSLYWLIGRIRPVASSTPEYTAVHHRGPPTNRPAESQQAASTIQPRQHHEVPKNALQFNQLAHSHTY